jgi:hypothetical protein
MESFVGSYAERDKTVDFSNWLAGRLQQEMPDMPAGAGQRLSEDIIEAVAKYDQTLDDLNRAVGSGQAKEEWLAGRLLESGAGMADAEAGGRLRQISGGLGAANAESMEALGYGGAGMAIDVEAFEAAETAEAAEAGEEIEWNEYSLKSETLNIGRQAAMSGLGAAAAVVKASIESGEMADAGEVAAQALRAGVETATGEVKAVVAGAIKTAAENGLTDLLPAGTPTESICDMAGAAVESASALFDAATGKTTVTEALDRAGRASVASVCRVGAEALKGSIECIPYFGPAIAQFAGGLLDHMKSPKFAENVYTVVREAAIATWEGIKQTGRSILSKLKNTFKRTVYN